MTSAIRQIADLLQKETTPEEYATIEVDMTRRHATLSLVIDNVKLSLPVPKSPSDHRWIKNWRTRFRQAYTKIKSGEAKNSYEALFAK